MYKSTDKEKAFEELINEIRPLLRKSISLDYGSASKKESEHTIQFKYKGHTVIIQLK